jgi:dienelactone hydrolase
MPAALLLTVLSAAPYETLFYRHEGLRLEEYLYRPAGPGPFPLVVYNHGSRYGREEMPMEHIGRLLSGAGFAVLVPERRGYGRSEGKPFGEEIGRDRGERYLARLREETGDALAGLEHVLGDPRWRLDRRRVALMGWSFGGIVTTLAAGGGSAFTAAIVQAPGAVSWLQSPALRKLLPEAARRIRIPVQCMVAENDATTESTRAVCSGAVHAPARDLRIYPPFLPQKARGDGAEGHELFGPGGESIWASDALAFLERYAKGG